MLAPSPDLRSYYKQIIYLPPTKVAIMAVVTDKGMEPIPTTSK